MKEKISIIVPCYNEEKYIERCINSILSQTLNNIELIIIDDGSKDNTYKICKNYEIKFPDKIKLFIRKIRTRYSKKYRDKICTRYIYRIC